MVGARTDLVAAVWLGLATFSKPTHVLLMLPVLALFALRRQWRRGLVAGVVYSAVVLGLFGVNIAVTGEWNYQGGDRKTFYSGGDSKGFPFQTEDRTFDTTGIGRATNSVPIEVLANRDAVVDVFRHNLVYFFVGRHTGFVAYYLPGVAAMVLFLAARRQRSSWGWLVLAGGLGSAVFLMLYMPFTYSGGGGPVGNRYFLGVYPVFLFLIPALSRAVDGGRHRGAQRALRGAAAEQPVLHVVLSGRAHQERTVPPSAAGAVARQRPAGERQPVAIAAAARRHAAAQRLLHGRQRLHPRRRRASGCAARAAPT